MTETNRKLVAAEFISLDGVVEAANEWMPPYFNDELGAVLGERMAESDTLVLGRVTYQEMVPAWAHRAGDDDPVAVHMSKPKLIVSTTLEHTDDWESSTLIGDDFAARLTELKRQPGETIFVIGSGTLVRSLLHENLLDELRLLVFPIVLGRGKRLFDGESDRMPLRLIYSKTFSTGVLSLTYAPAHD